MEDTEVEKLHEHLEQVLEKQLSWIQSADAKAAIVLPISIAMTGTVAALAPKIMCSWEMISIFSIAVTFLLLVFSIIFLGLSTFPRTSGPKNSLIYFGGISRNSLEEFKSKALKLTSSAYTEDLINQIHRNAQIASIKHTAIKRSIICLYLVIIPWAYTVYILYGLEK